VAMTMSESRRCVACLSWCQGWRLASTRPLHWLPLSTGARSRQGMLRVVWRGEGCVGVRRRYPAGTDRSVEPLPGPAGDDERVPDESRLGAMHGKIPRTGATHNFSAPPWVGKAARHPGYREVPLTLLFVMPSPLPERWQMWVCFSRGRHRFRRPLRVSRPAPRVSSQRATWKPGNFRRLTVLLMGDQARAPAMAVGCLSRRRVAMCRRSSLLRRDAHETARRHPSINTNQRPPGDLVGGRVPTVGWHEPCKNPPQTAAGFRRGLEPRTNRPSPLHLPFPLPLGYLLPTVAAVFIPLFGLRTVNALVPGILLPALPAPAGRRPLAAPGIGDPWSARPAVSRTR